MCSGSHWPPLCIEYPCYISSSCLINYLPSHAFIVKYGNGETTSDHVFGLQVLEFDPWSCTLVGQVDIPRLFASVFPETKGLCRRHMVAKQAARFQVCVLVEICPKLCDC